MDLNHLTIGTEDLKASVDFYTNQLNFEIDYRYRIGKPSEIVILTNDLDILEIVSGNETCVYESEGYTFNKKVKDLDEILIYCKHQQIKVLVPPTYMSDHKRMMVIIDRHGLKIELFEHLMN